MKTLCLNNYNEKLTINPINNKDLEKIFGFFYYEHINLNTVTLKDIKPGWIAKITETNVNLHQTTDIAVFYDYEHIIKLFPNYMYVNTDCFLCITKDGDFEYLNINGFNGFERTWKITTIKVTDIWKTDIDITQFKNINDFYEFYKKYDLYNKFINL